MFMRKIFLLFLVVAVACTASACKIQHTRTVDESSGDGRYIEHTVRIAEPFSGEDHGVDVYHSKRPADKTAAPADDDE